MPKFEVWHEHEVIAEFPIGTTWANDDQGGVDILNAQGERVRHFDRGEWSAVGTGIVCGFLTEKEDCPRCRLPKLESEAC